ncbi:MAG: DUF2726 domain-containing protein [Rhodothermales bacterium]
MAASPAEQLFQHIHAHRWAEALAVVYARREAIPDDPLLQHALATLVDAFLNDLGADGPLPHADALDTLFLLHTGAFVVLPEAAFTQVVVALVHLHKDRPETAVGYARFCPDAPACAALIAAHTPDTLRTDAEATVTTQPARASRDAIQPLFRSRQEATFFTAVREVFPMYAVYPNVALHACLDADALRPHLDAAERAYLFRALVDCVVFDQHDGYRPRYFFELDSPWHDLPERKAQDRRKDHILAEAGQRLYRIRMHERNPTVAQFVALLRDVVR